MRISEITDKNKTILTISGIAIDFEEDYKLLIKLLTTLLPLKTPSRNKRALINISEFEDKAQKFLQNKLLDRADPDIINLINSLAQMQDHINSLKSQMIF